MMLTNFKPIKYEAAYVVEGVLQGAAFISGRTIAKQYPDLIWQEAAFNVTRRPCRGILQ